MKTFGIEPNSTKVLTRSTRKITTRIGLDRVGSDPMPVQGYTIEMVELHVIRKYLD